MVRLMRLHEAFIRRALSGELGEQPWDELADFHAEQLAFMQHERLIHLLVTLSFAVFFLLTAGYMTTTGSLAAASLAALLLVMVGAYVVHYFRLENGVQRWYVLAHALREKAGRAGADYTGKAARPFGPGASPNRPNRPNQ